MLKSRFSVDFLLALVSHINLGSSQVGLFVVMCRGQRCLVLSSPFGLSCRQLRLASLRSCVAGHSAGSVAADCLREDSFPLDTHTPGTFVWKKTHSCSFRCCVTCRSVFSCLSQFFVSRIPGACRSRIPRACHWWLSCHSIDDGVHWTLLGFSPWDSVPAEHSRTHPEDF